MDSLSLNNVFNITAKFIFGSVVALPLSLSNYSLSHQKGLNLNYSKTSPPLAIFDDEKIPTFVDDFETPTKRAEKLFATKLIKHRKQAAVMAKKISKEFAALQAKTESRPAPVQIRSLAGLSIKKNSEQITSVTQVSLPSHPASHAQKKVEFIETLRPSLRARVQEVENFDDILSQDFSAGDTTETFARRAQKVLSDSGVILSNRPAPSKAKAKTNLAQQIAPRINPKPASSPRDISKRFANSGYGRSGLKPKDHTPSDKRPDNSEDSLEKIAKDFTPGGHPDYTDEKSTEKGAVSVASTGMPLKPKNLTQALISGPIEISGGLAFTNNNQQIIVYRQIAGTKHEFGQVVVQEGRYEIYVEDPSTGILVAELIDHGDMIGRAEISVPEVVLTSKNKEDFKNIPIKIRPITDRVVVSTVSEYDIFTNQKLKSAKVLIADALQGEQQLLNSTILLKASADGHWGNITIGSTRSPFLNILTPESTIKALADILGITIPKDLMGIIRGEVKIADKKIAGAQVELIGDAYAQPVYFNSFLPDKSLNATSDNGEFAFIGLNPGNYLVRAKYQGKYLSPHLAPVENGFITRTVFDVQAPSLSEAFVFDLQTSETMSAHLSFLGSDQKAFVQSRKLISFSGSDGVQFLEATTDDQNFYSTRVTVDKSEKEILIPMVSYGWLSNLLSRLKVNVAPDTGMIIGTAPNLPYAVELDQNGYNNETQVIYFDQQGNAAPGTTVTPVGGGFVIINVNSGVRSLFARYYGAKNIKVTTLAVDGAAINIYPSKL